MRADRDPSNIVHHRSRIFWLRLPPLSPKRRMAAARTALRARLANPLACQFVLSETPRADGLWCAVVTDRGCAFPRNAHVVAATVPWRPGTVTWVRGSGADFAISARGESMDVDEAEDDQLPDLIVRLCSEEATALVVRGTLAPEARALWEAQLGIPVWQSTEPLSAAVTWSAPQTLEQAAPRETAVPRFAPWIALLAGIAHLCFAVWEALGVWRTQGDVRAEMAAIAAKHDQSADTWRAWVRESAPAAARDSAASLIEIVAPALATTASRVSSLHFEQHALTVEWTALDDRERAAFEQAIAAAGGGVVGGAKRARVLVP